MQRAHKQTGTRTKIPRHGRYAAAEYSCQQHAAGGRLADGGGKKAVARRHTADSPNQKGRQKHPAQGGQIDAHRYPAGGKARSKPRV